MKILRANCDRRGVVRAVVGALIAVCLSGCDRGAATSSTSAAANSGSTGTESRPNKVSHVPDRVILPRVADSERNSPRLRIISMAPSITEMVCALGLADQLVGRTSYCRYPPEIRNVTALGALLDLNVEALVSLKPDMVLVVAHSQAQTDRFGQVGLRVEVIPDTTLEDVFAGLTRIGALTGRVKTAQAVCSAIRGDLDQVLKETRGTPPMRVLLATGVMGDPPAPPFVAGPGSIYDDLIQLAGHLNAAADLGRGFAPLSLEAILRADPDVIIELDPENSRPGGDAEAARVWAKIGDLRAVRGGGVRVLKGPQHYLTGPRIAETLAGICAACSTQPINRGDSEIAGGGK